MVFNFLGFEGIHEMFKTMKINHIKSGYCNDISNKTLVTMLAYHLCLPSCTLTYFCNLKEVWPFCFYECLYKSMVIFFLNFIQK